jgi:hypothetical protein
MSSAMQCSAIRLDEVRFQQRKFKVERATQNWSRSSSKPLSVDVAKTSTLGPALPLVATAASWHYPLRCHEHHLSVNCLVARSSQISWYNLTRLWPEFLLFPEDCLILYSMVGQLMRSMKARRNVMAFNHSLNVD